MPGPLFCGTGFPAGLLVSRLSLLVLRCLWDRFLPVGPALSFVGPAFQPVPGDRAGRPRPAPHVFSPSHRDSRSCPLHVQARSRAFPAAAPYGPPTAHPFQFRVSSPLPPDGGRPFGDRLTGNPSPHSPSSQAQRAFNRLFDPRASPLARTVLARRNAGPVHPASCRSLRSIAQTVPAPHATSPASGSFPCAVRSSRAKVRDSTQSEVRDSTQSAEARQSNLF